MALAQLDQRVWIDSTFEVQVEFGLGELKNEVADR
jgi:hypothetical protein